MKFAAELGELLPERFELHRHGGRSYIGFAPVAPVSWLKRAFDLVFGALALLGLSPFMLAIALAIKLDSPGPVFYAQERVGKDGVRFRMWKFRSMRQDADRLLEELRAQNEASGPLFKMKRDPRVTAVGRFLRRSSLDELPQLFNVMIGQMSLVGPRPPVPSEVEQYEDWQHGRLQGDPGHDRPLAGERPERRAVPRHGAAGSALHPQLVALAGPRDHPAHHPRCHWQSGRVLNETSKRCAFVPFR